MRLRAMTGIALGVLAMSAAQPARAAPATSHRAIPADRPSLAPMIGAAAAWAGVPVELLASVVWLESGGWPLALNVRGMGLYPRSHAEAVTVIRAASGRADIGLAQIHYPIWGPVFGLRPEELLDPRVNLHVAARLLRHAMEQEPGSWAGVGRYHSATPWRKWRYARRVAEVVRVLRAPATPALPP
jgi:hypothetical protein